MCTLYSPTKVIIETFVDYLQTTYLNQYGGHSSDADVHLLGSTAKIALITIANSDALYHDLEHTILVTVTGQEILQGKLHCGEAVSRQDWLQMLIAMLCHDIGYVKGSCSEDRPLDGWFTTGLGSKMVFLPPGSTDASLTPYHVDRGKQFVVKQLADSAIVDVQAIQASIEMTRFPVPAQEAYQATRSYPGLVRAADLIGQLSDKHYLQKTPALFQEFAETGANQKLGYHHSGDLRAGYPNFYRHVVYNYIQPALHYLDQTEQGRQIVADLSANVFLAEQELLRTQGSLSGGQLQVLSGSQMTPQITHDRCVAKLSA